MSDVINVLGNRNGRYMEVVREDTPLLCRSTNSNRSGGVVDVPIRGFNESNTFERIWLACLFIIFTFGVAIGTYLLYKEGNPDQTEKLTIIARRHWDTSTNSSSTNERNIISKLKLPIQYVLITQTNTTKCDNKFECIESMHNLERLDVQVLGEQDIMFNFMIGGEGRIYEGRGWLNSTGRMHFGTEVLSIAFSGTFDNYAPANIQISAALSFFDYAIMRYKLDPCFQVLADNSCGRYLHNIVLEIDDTVKQTNMC